MAKLKKILAAVLTVSLLTGFSVSAASFATEYDMYDGISELFSREDYITDVEDYNGNPRDTVFRVKVSNSAVAQANGVECYGEGNDEIIYHLIDKGYSISICQIDAENTHIYVPRTFFGKPVEIDEFLNYRWDSSHKDKVVFVPKVFAFTFKEVIERRFEEELYWHEKENEVGFFDGPISVISYEDCQ